MSRFFKQIEHDMSFDINTLAELQRYYRGQNNRITPIWNKLEKRADEVLTLGRDLTVIDIDYDPVRLVMQVSKLSGVESTVAYLHTQAESFMPVFRAMYIMAKRKEVTESDRENWLEIRMIKLTTVVAELKVVKERLHDRIIACQSILKAVKENE